MALEAMKNMVKTVTLSARGLNIEAENGTASQINELLVKAGIRVQALIPLESSLEEAFIRLTDKNGQTAPDKIEAPDNAEASVKEDNK